MPDLFAGGGEPPITRDEKVRELKNEITMRERVFGRQVELKQMRETTMKRRIAIIQAVVDDYEKGRVSDG